MNTALLLVVGDMHLGRRPSHVPDDLREYGVDPDELTPAASWRLVIEHALQRQVHAVVLAGDVVDGDNARFEAFGRLQSGVEKLIRNGITVFAVAGNHDVDALPRLADLIPGFRLLGRGGTWEAAVIHDAVQLIGWSFPRPVVRESPLASGIKLETTRSNLSAIGLLHCDLDATKTSYAPVARVELERTGFRACFLGHIHKPSDLSGERPIGYLGSLVGLDPTETGPHGPWLVRFAAGTLEARHEPIAPLRWEQIEVDVEEGGYQPGDDLLGLFKRALEDRHRQISADGGAHRAVGCRIRLTGRTGHARALRRAVDVPEVSKFRHKLDGTVYFVDKVTCDFRQALDLSRIARSADPPLWVWVVLGLMLVGGAALAVAHHPAGLFLVGLSAGASAILLFRWRFSENRFEVGRHVQDFEETGLVAPERWEPGEVLTEVRRLEGRWSKAKLQEEHQARKAKLDSEKRQLEEEEQSLERQREQFLTQLGLDLKTGDLTLVDFARNLADLRRVERDHQSAEEALDSLTKKHAEALMEVNGFLGRHGEEAGTRYAEVLPRIEDLEARSEKLRSALERKKDKEQQKRGLDGEESRLRERRAVFWKRVELEEGDRAGLQERLRRQEDWQKVLEQKKNLQFQIGKIEKELSEREDLLQIQPEELDRREQEKREQAESLDELKEKRFAIREKIKNARESHDMEEAKDLVTKAMDRLADRREEAMTKAAGAFLLRKAQETHDRECRPEVLKRAANLFATFTRHEYELVIDRQSNAPAFRAKETRTGAGRALQELSDATRIQLLLAARLGFALQQERGVAVPVFLDEVLTTTDPERFGAIARSLGSLVREQDRQVFYLTADPADVAAWCEYMKAEGLEVPSKVDLGEIRRLSKAVSSPEALWVPPARTFSAPQGLTREEYGVRVQVTLVDPRAPLESLHLFHLVGEDLDSLYKLLQAGIETVGQWRSLVDNDAANTILEESPVRQINAAVEVADAFLDAWRIGRGCRVTREAMDGAGLTPKASALVGELIEESGGDARQLMDTIDRREDERIKGFRKDQAEKLRTHLADNGFFDVRVMLNEDQTLARVLKWAGASIRAGDITVSEVSRQVRELIARVSAR